MAGSKWMTPTKVGVLLVLAGVAFAGFLQLLSTRGLERGEGYRVFALFDDVLGLEKRSPVQIAGIDIGHIERVELFQGKAKVTLYIDEGIALFEDAKIEKIAISLLGDYKLSVEPGTERLRKLKDGDEIKHVISRAATDQIIDEVKEISRSIGKLVKGTAEDPAPLERIVRDVEGSAAAARQVLEVVAKDIDQNTGQLERILENVERFTRDLSQISEGREQDIAAILKDTREIAASLKRTSKNVEQIIAGQDEEEITETVKSLRQTLDSTNEAVERLASVARKVDEGEGTVGALVNDRSIHDGVEDAVDGVNSVLGGITRLKTWVNLRSEFQFRAGATKNYVQFALVPSEDSYYLFEAVDDPRGVRTIVVEDVETTSPEPGRDFVYRERRTTTKEGLKFSLAFAKRFSWLGLRFGIIEGTGGVGADAHFLEDRVQLWVDANQFASESRNPRIKVLAQLDVVPHLYVHGGIDDFLNPGTLDYFLGAGVRFKDDDLKALMFAVGLPTGASQ
ncbi:MAG: MCE family protein [Deltaproteobacteria bacterium]|nr:MCE family protein [Deltaproteobacteria bacterium]